VLSLEVSDNGRGLSRADLAKARSFGLRGLHERADTVGGWVDVSSSAAGTVLMLSVPMRGVAGAGRAEGETDFDQDDDHDPTGWGTP
jgi:signal transduction histidine kinase